MINVQLLNYVNEQKEKGFTKDQITSSLLSNGWPQSDIDDCFSSILSSSPSILVKTPTLPSSPAGQVNIGPALNTTNTNASLTTTYAGFWLRFAASLVDGFILNVIFALFAFVFWFMSKSISVLSDNTSTIINILYLIMWLLYFPYMESRSGATFGKKLAGIRVVSIDGQQVNFLKSFIRNISKILSAIIFMIGFIMAGFTQKKQGLHDIIAGCVVVKNGETHVGRVWAIILIMIVACVGTVIIVGAQIMLMFASLFSGGIKLESSAETPGEINFQIESNSSASVSYMKKEYYDNYFAKQISPQDGLQQSSGPAANAGPAVIALKDEYLDISLPIMASELQGDAFGRGLIPGSVWIQLSSVLSRDSKEVIHSNELDERDPNYDDLRLSKTNGHLSATRPIEHNSLPGKFDPQTIIGTLHFKMSLDSENSGEYYERSYPFTITN